MIEGAVNAGLPQHAIQIIRTPGHEAVGELLKMDAYVDVLIPRGGKGLIKRIAEGTRIPVIKHYDGICHLYLAEDADPEQAVELAINSKCQSIQVCNALETLLVDKKCAEHMLPLLQAAFDANTAIQSILKTRQSEPLPFYFEHALASPWLEPAVLCYQC